MDDMLFKAIAKRTQGAQEIDTLYIAPRIHNSVSLKL